MKRRKSRCKMCDQEFSHRIYPAGGGVYCSEVCKKRAYALGLKGVPRAQPTRVERAIAYNAYLHSPEWKTKRKHVLARAKNRCERCGSDGRLDVHHLTYARFKHERLDDLQALCRPCHGEVHGIKEAAKKVRTAKKKRPKGPAKQPKAKRLRLVAENEGISRTLAENAQRRADRATWERPA